MFPMTLQFCSYILLHHLALEDGACLAIICTLHTTISIYDECTYSDLDQSLIASNKYITAGFHPERNIVNNDLGIGGAMPLISSSCDSQDLTYSATAFRESHMLKRHQVRDLFYFWALSSYSCSDGFSGDLLRAPLLVQVQVSRRCRENP